MEENIPEPEYEFIYRKNINQVKCTPGDMLTLYLNNKEVCSYPVLGYVNMNHVDVIGFKDYLGMEKGYSIIIGQQDKE